MGKQYEIVEQYLKINIASDIDNYPEGTMIDQYIEFKTDDILEKFRIQFNGIEIIRSDFKYWEEDNWYILKGTIDV